jgi:hypothetical protein
VLLMTRWAMRDIAARILEDEGRRWRVLALQAQEPNPAKCEGCAANLKVEKPEPHDCQAPYLWEEHYGRERYEEAKKDNYIWEAMWQQMPEPRMLIGFDAAWLEHMFYEPRDMEKIVRYNAYMFVDPAMGKEAAHDRSAIMVVVAGPEKKMFLVDGVLDRLDPSERINHIIRLARIWKPKQVIYEEYALTADTHFLKLKCEQEDMTDLIITSVGRAAIKGMDGGRLKKHDRIMQLQPDFRDGRFWFPKKMERKLLDGSWFDIMSYFINREFLPYAGEGSIENDDMLDCLSRVHDPAVSMEFVESNKSIESFDNEAANGSWEVWT